MEKIDGIDLGELVKQAEAEVLKDHRDRIGRVVSGIMVDVKQWKEEKIKKASELKSLDDKITKAIEKLGKIREGDWSLIPDPKKEKDGDK